MQIPFNDPTAERVSKSKIKALRDKAVIADRYEQVDSALRIIAPHLQRTDLVNFPYGKEPDEQQTVVKLSGESSYIPLKSLGEGMNRLFEIALTTVNAKDSLLLIDEIDNGLHHAIQVDVWRMIFSLAERLNIQILATTHSWDCIEAFQAAASQNEEVEGLLLSLRNKKGKPGELVAIAADEEDLDMIVSYPMIEVR